MIIVYCIIQIGDSSSNEEGDDSTLKGQGEWDDRYSQHGSTSEFSSSSSLDRTKNTKG